MVGPNNPAAEKTTCFHSRPYTCTSEKHLVEPEKSKHLKSRRPVLSVDYGRFRGVQALAAGADRLGSNGFFPHDRLP